MIPENLGYIAPPPFRVPHWSVKAQLQRAAILSIIRDTMALGFIHPVVVPLEELKQLVQGLKKMGYTFADPWRFPTGVHYDYVPPREELNKTWLGATLGINVRKFSRWLDMARDNVVKGTYSLVAILNWLGQAQASEVRLAMPYHGKADPRCEPYLR